jgi:hypothetical protein
MKWRRRCAKKIGIRDLSAAPLAVPAFFYFSFQIATLNRSGLQFSHPGDTLLRGYTGLFGDRRPGRQGT